MAYRKSYGKKRYGKKRSFKKGKGKGRRLGKKYTIARRGGRM